MDLPDPDAFNTSLTDVLPKLHPADRAKAERSVRKLYELSRKPAPSTYTWCLSPTAALDYLLGKYKILQEFERTWHGQPSGLRSAVVHHVMAAAHGRTDTRVELGTIDFYYLSQIVKDKDEFAIHLSEVLANCTVWWALRQEVVFVENPLEAHTLGDGEIHNLTGPAVVWRDGYKDYAIEGIRVTEHVITDPSKITVEEIQALGNRVEARRIYISRMGMARFLRESKAELIDMDGGLAGPGGAPRALLRDCFGRQWLYCTDGSTERVYILSVPPTAVTCREAHEAISGLVDESVIACEA